MRRAEQPFVHGSGRLDGDEIIYQAFINAPTKLAEGLGEHKVGLGGIDLILTEATGIHDGKVGPQALADLLIRGAQFMLQQLQGEQDADGHGSATTGGFFRKPLVETLLNGADERGPGKGVRPLPDGMQDGDKICDLQAGSGTAQPMLEITHHTHRWLSYGKGEREP